MLAHTGLGEQLYTAFAGLTCVHCPWIPVNRTACYSSVCGDFFPFPRLNSHSHASYSHSHPIPIPMTDRIPIPTGIPRDPWDPSLSIPIFLTFSCRNRWLVHFLWRLSMLMLSFICAKTHQTSAFSIRMVIRQQPWHRQRLNFRFRCRPNCLFISVYRPVARRGFNWFDRTPPPQLPAVM